MKWNYDGLCLQNKRDTNMDGLLLSKKCICNRNLLLAVVCDGVGSMKDGAIAASTSIQILSHWFDALENEGQIGLQMRDTISGINAHIVDKAKEIGWKTATTISALLLTETMYHIVHAGDSRIYHYTDRVLHQLTQDDLSESGKLTACIGHWSEPRLSYMEGKLQEGSFLLCTDGLYRHIKQDILLSEIEIMHHRTLNKTLKKLSQRAISNGEQDNISLALIKIDN